MEKPNASVFGLVQADFPPSVRIGLQAACRLKWLHPLKSFRPLYPVHRHDDPSMPKYRDRFAHSKSSSNPAYSCSTSNLSCPHTRIRRQPPLLWVYRRDNFKTCTWCTDPCCPPSEPQHVETSGFGAQYCCLRIGTNWAQLKRTEVCWGRTLNDESHRHYCLGHLTKC